MATQYARDRKAFGESIGRFQATKQKLADMFVANELARSHAYHAVWAMDRSPATLPVAAAAARVAASEAFWLTTRECIQIHGAIGFTWEHDAHLFYRRAHHLSLALGSPLWWKDRLFAAIAEADMATDDGAAVHRPVVKQALASNG